MRPLNQPSLLDQYSRIEEKYTPLLSFGVYQVFLLLFYNLHYMSIDRTRIINQHRFDPRHDFPSLLHPPTTYSPPINNNQDRQLMENMDTSEIPLESP